MKIYYGDHRGDRTRAEKAAAFARLAVIVITAVGMMLLRSVLIEMSRAHAMVAVVETVHRDGALLDRHGDGWRREAQSIQHDKNACRAPTPFCR